MRSEEDALQRVPANHVKVLAERTEELHPAPGVRLVVNSPPAEAFVAGKPLKLPGSEFRVPSWLAGRVCSQAAFSVPSSASFQLGTRNPELGTSSLGTAEVRGFVSSQENR